MIRRDTRVSKKPYDGIPSRGARRKVGDGIFSRIKRIFSASSGATATDETQKETATRGSGTANATANLSEISYTNLSNVSTVSDMLNSRNPNETLAEFFQRKGDKPLSDVEVEGVLSLIDRANKQSHQMMLQSSPVQHAPNRSVNLSRNGSHTGVNFDNSLLNTSTTTILRPSALKTPVKVQTPGYTSRVTKNSSAIPQTIKRRVVNYSALPSPYRSRISSPLSSFMSKQEKLKEQRKNTSTQSISKVTKPEKPAMTKPISKTATKVLSLLNESETPQISQPPPTPPKTLPIIPKKPIQRPAKLETPTLPKQEEQKPLGLKPVTTETKKPTTFEFSKPTDTTEISLPKPETASPPKLLFSFTPTPLKESNEKAMEIPPQTHNSKPEPKVEPVVKGGAASHSDEIEIIDRFVFPEVCEEQINGTKQQPTSSAVATVEVIETFDFPDVLMVDADTLKSIREDAVHLYDAEFTF